MLHEVFNSVEWSVSEDGLFADNRLTGERILLERFKDEYKSGIVKTSGHGQTDSFTLWNAVRKQQ